jgi:hypothetical protein
VPAAYGIGSIKYALSSISAIIILQMIDVMKAKKRSYANVSQPGLLG